MPELPEVEQVRKSLLPHIKGKKIEQADIRLPRMILSPALPDFIRGVEGRSFADVKRRGKYLLLELDDTNVILTHLRMTGSLLALPKNAPEPAFGKIRLRLSGTEDLWFTDLRTFGTMRLLKPSEFSLDKGFSSLGPEPLSEEFTEEYLKAVLKKSHQAIKSLLLDQRKIAGLGNIYVDEALAAAGIRENVSLECLKKILDCVTTEEALAFIDAEGKKEDVMEDIMEKIDFYLKKRAAGRLQIECIVYSNTYGLLGMTAKAEELLRRLL